MVLNRSRSPSPLLVLLDPDADGSAAVRSSALRHLSVSVPAEALALLRRVEQPCGLLVLAWSSAADGILRALKADPFTRHVPVLVVAPRPSAQEATHCYRAGASCYLPRPADPGAYAALLQSVMEFWLRGAVVLPHLARR